jgi:hypothetical protein
VSLETSPSFILIGRGRTYTILLEKEETKTLLLQVLNETIAKWIESDPKIKGTNNPFVTYERSHKIHVNHQCFGIRNEN